MMMASNERAPVSMPGPSGCVCGHNIQSANDLREGHLASKRRSSKRQQHRQEQQKHQQEQVEEEGEGQKTQDAVVCHPSLPNVLSTHEGEQDAIDASFVHLPATRWGQHEGVLQTLNETETLARIAKGRNDGSTVDDSPLSLTYVERYDLQRDGSVWCFVHLVYVAVWVFCCLSYC